MAHRDVQAATSDCLQGCTQDVLLLLLDVPLKLCLHFRPRASSRLASWRDMRLKSLRVGLLQPLVEGLHSAGRELGLPFLAHADEQAAISLLLLLEACPVLIQHTGV